VLTLDQKQRWRELILTELYDRTGGDPLNGLTPSELIEGIHRRLGYPVAFPPDGKTAFVVNQASNSVSTIDVKTRTKNPTDINVGAIPIGEAITPCRR
jgi:YVTN family beta-propeller protein